MAKGSTGAQTPWTAVSRSNLVKLSVENVPSRGDRLSVRGDDGRGSTFTEGNVKIFGAGGSVMAGDSAEKAQPRGRNAMGLIIDIL